MKNLLFVISTFCALNVNAQNYLITFSGTGAANTVTSVEVENLATGITRTVNGDDVLRLTGTVGISDALNEYSERIKIYPNPMTEKSTLQISPPVEGDAIISVYDITGKVITQLDNYLDNYTQEFTLSGLKNGTFIVNVKGISYQFSGKLISNGKSDGPASIMKATAGIAIDKKVSNIDTKGTMATVDMEYAFGNRLKFKAISGNYSTVMTLIPDADKTITFNFIACTDGENINYPIVEIGTQVWMAENLKTTKYNDEADIPLVADSIAWFNLITPAYVWYKNEPSYGNTYGAIYNWYTVKTGKLCPNDWHLPNEAEFTSLISYLGGESPAGGKLKESGTTHWYGPNSGANNEVGFTALPGGFRDQISRFDFVRSGGFWWGATEGSEEVLSLSIFYNGWNAYIGLGGSKIFGHSVRCIKD